MDDIGEMIQTLLDEGQGGCYNTGLEPGFVPVRLRGIVAAFEDFDKWSTWGLCYAAITSGRATLAEIEKIALDVASIVPHVTRTRMTDFSKMPDRVSGVEPTPVVCGPECLFDHVRPDGRCRCTGRGVAS